MCGNQSVPGRFFLFGALRRLLVSLFNIQTGFLDSPLLFADESGNEVCRQVGKWLVIAAILHIVLMFRVNSTDLSFFLFFKCHKYY